MMLPQKGKDFAKKLDMVIILKTAVGAFNALKVSTMCFQKTLGGKSIYITQSVSEDWIINIPSLEKEYKPIAVFNVDEEDFFLSIYWTELLQLRMERAKYR